MVKQIPEGALIQAVNGCLQIDFFVQCLLHASGQKTPGWFSTMAVGVTFEMSAPHPIANDVIQGPDGRLLQSTNDQAAPVSGVFR
jgi:hypothetical protein